jgi:hypothetical protein
MAESTTPKPEAQASSEIRIPMHDPVPTLFADGCHSANVIAGCARLDLFVERAWHGMPGTQQMVVGRIVIPLERLDAFARGMSELVKRIKDEVAKRGAGSADKVADKTD